MKTSTKHLKVVALIFSVVILFQSCVTVYKSGNVTLEEAVRADTKVRISTNDNKTIIHKCLILSNMFYIIFTLLLTTIQDQSAAIFF